MDEKKKKQAEYLAIRKSGDTSWVEPYLTEKQKGKKRNTNMPTVKIVKKEILDYFGGYDNTWKKLGYKSIQPVYNWPQNISEGLMLAIIRRMKAERIDVPKEWLA